ncbi:MAG: hypothetical protein IT386_09250 [Deltaproteobacteria bacterium]|nr:hypothetical protein [Deltaproteobacteria bacterium]
MSLWIFWLPAFAIGVVLARWAGRRQEGPWLALAAFLGFLARFLSGYEYITESVALAAAPILYYSLRDAVGVGVFLKRAVIATGASALALALSLGILTLQIGQVTGSSGDAWKHIEFAIARRIRGDRSQLPPVYSSSLQAETNAVLAFYLVDAFDREAQEKPPALRWLLGRRHIDLIALVLAAALWVAVRAAWLPAERRSRALGLVAATAGTLAGVLAWLIVFKAHSFIHWHVNPLLWHLGFFQLGAALVGLAVADALRLIAVTARPPASQRGS